MNSNDSTTGLVSIVIPAYNCEKYIQHALDSILGQTYASIEVLIADDGSSDGTRAIIDSFPDGRLRKLHNETNRGYLQTCNRLMRESTGEYITFQDADDWSEPERLEILVGRLKADPALYAVGSAVNKVDEKSRFLGVRTFPLKHSEALEVMSHRGKAACVGTVMFRAEILDSVGVYREYFDRKCFEHVDWLYRVMERYKFENVEQPLYNYRNNPSSVTSDFSDEKIALREIVHVLGEQRALTGSDMISDGREQELDALQRDIISDKLARDPLHFCKVRINRSLRNFDAHDFRDAIREMCRRSWWRPAAWGVLAVSLVKYALGLQRYYRIRDSLLGKSALPS